MPDLTGSYLGANYRRALDNFSRFGTRKLAFYTIWIYGIDDATRDSLYYLEEDYNADSTDFPWEWIETPGNILEAVQRGVQMVAEPYYYGDWDINEEDPNYNDLYLTVVVAADTVQDGYEQEQENHSNPNSYSIEGAIYNAISNFQNDGVYVQQAYIRGDYVYEDGGDNALSRLAARQSSRNSPANKERIAALKAARAAAGKPGYKG